MRGYEPVRKEKRVLNDKVAITGLAMLETMWASRHKDLLDLITPFVFYAIAQKTSPNEEVDIGHTLKFMREHYGYADMPKSIVTKILKRNIKTTFEKRNKSYYLVRDLGPEADQMEHRKKECEQYINEVGEQLSKYLIKNCKKRSRFNAQSATSYLHAFFKYYGLYVGIDRLEQAKGLTSSQNEVNYYIAQYIFEKKMENSAEYFHILNLVKGYFLQTAIYLQPENGNLVDAKFKDLEIYYDTPILLDLLGYHSDEEKDAAQNLHNALRMKKAKCHYFPYAEQEINAILHAYKCSLEHRDFRRHHWNTLENLNRRNCTPSYIDVLLAKWPNDLNASYNGISEKDFPSHPQKGNGEINARLLLEEEEIKRIIRERNARYPDDDLDRDVESVAAIYRIRGGVVSGDIERARAIHMTEEWIRFRHSRETIADECIFSTTAYSGNHE